jgi:hypothetical protein
MADFIVGGHFGRHLRRMQRIYGERQRSLIDALGRWTSEYISVIPSHAGLHVSATLDRGFDAPELVRRAGEAGVGIYSTAPFYRRAAEPGLIFGYATCSVDDIDEGVRRLGALLRSMSPPKCAPTQQFAAPAPISFVDGKVFVGDGRLVRLPMAPIGDSIWAADHPLTRADP